MGDASDIQELLHKASIDRWKARAKLVAIVLSTFFGSFLGGAFLAGQLLERAVNVLAGIDKQQQAAATTVAKLAERVDHHDDQIKEAYTVGVDGKRIAVQQCQRLDAFRPERFCP